LFRRTKPAFPLWHSWIPAERLSSPPLNGYFQVPAPLPLSFSSWFAMEADSSFQENRTQLAKDSLTWKPGLVRLNNQWKYQLFRAIDPKRIIAGKKGYFFGRNDVQDFLGARFRGEAIIAEEVKKLRKVQDTLAQTGTSLLYVMAPSKAAFFPQYLPGHLQPMGAPPTNAARYRYHLQEESVNVLDVTPWFKGIQDTCQYPLYPKGGYHWSEYGSWIFTDSLLKRIEHLSGFDLLEEKFVRMDQTEVPRGADQDIGKAANLWKDPKAETLAYPIIEVHPFDSSRHHRPKVLTIGDSYHWTLIGTFVPHRYYAADWRFWYYHKAVWKLNEQLPYTVPEIEAYAQRLQNFEVIVLIFAEENLYQGMWEFTERAYQAFYPES
ncbi:MAG: hypothetical protein AAFR61_32840, partial [Bacteroidota bacterium]